MAMDSRRYDFDPRESLSARNCPALPLPPYPEANLGPLLREREGTKCGQRGKLDGTAKNGCNTLGRAIVGFDRSSGRTIISGTGFECG